MNNTEITNQNNNSSDNQINPSSKVIIFMTSSSHQDYTKIKQNVIKTAQEDYGDIIETIESKGCDDDNALDQLISLVNSHNYTSSSLILLVEKRLVDAPIFAMFAVILYTLNAIKPIEIKIFRSTCVNINDDLVYITRAYTLDNYLSWAKTKEKNLLQIAIYNFIPIQQIQTNLKKLFN